MCNIVKRLCSNDVSALFVVPCVECLFHEIHPNLMHSVIHFSSRTFLQMCTTKKEKKRRKIRRMHGTWGIGMGLSITTKVWWKHFIFYLRIGLESSVYKSKLRQIIDSQKWILVRRSKNEGDGVNLHVQKENSSVGNERTQQLIHRRAQVVMLRPNKKQGSNLRDYYRWVDW